MSRLSTLYKSAWAVSHGPSMLNQIVEILKVIQTNLSAITHQRTKHYPQGHTLDIQNIMLVHQNLKSCLQIIKGSLKTIDQCLHSLSWRTLYALKGTYEAQDLFNELYVVGHGISEILQPLQGGSCAMRHDYEFAQAALIISGRIGGLLS